MSLYIISQSGAKPEIAVEFDQENRCEIYNSFIKSEMKEFGVYIPPGLREQYANRNYVLLPDSEISDLAERSLFKKAFIEIYFDLHLSNSKFVKAHSKEGL